MAEGAAVTDGGLPLSKALKLYRLWRTVTLLTAVGAVEFAVLAYMRRNWWVGLIAVPLVGIAMAAGRRAAQLRRAVSAR